MYRDFVALSLRNIRGKGIRSWLTMTGIVIGIAAIVSLISLGEGLQDALNEQFSMLGSNLIYVQPGSSIMSSFSPGGAGSELTDRELGIIRDVRGVDLAGGFITRLSKVKFRDEVMYTYVIGMGTDDLQDLWLDSGGVAVERGNEFKKGDDDKVMVGYEFWAGKVFKRPVGLGDTIEIDDRKFEISGEISRIGNPSDDSQLYLTLDAAKDLYDIEDDYIVIMARVKDGYDVKKVAEKIKDDLRRDRGLKEGEEDFTLMTLEELRDSVTVILDAVQAIVIGIAFISLLVGGIGIMNTMYTSVLERTKEIGVMKAVGARNESVLALFMIEAGIIGMVGGLAGCLIGAGFGKAVELIAEQQLDQVLIKASITPELLLGSLFFSFLVGVIAGTLPARQASKLNPVDALRYE